MRTTVTLEPDVHALLEEASRRMGKPFKRVLNDALRAGLKSQGAGPESPPNWPCFDMGAPLVDLRKARALADELDDTRR